MIPFTTLLCIFMIFSLIPAGAHILPVPKEPIWSKLRGRLRLLLRITLSESWITSHFKIQFVTSTFLNFYLIVFGRVGNSAHFGIVLHLHSLWIYVLWWKRFKLWRHFWRPGVFHIWREKIISVPTSPKMPNIAEFFRRKTFGDIGSSPVLYLLSIFDLN